MNQYFSAFSVLAFMVTAVVALPSCAPPVLANEAAALAKGDRLNVIRATHCAEQIWPNLLLSCLHSVQRSAIQEARLVTTERR